MPPMHDPWQPGAHPQLEATPHGWLRPTDAWLRPFLTLPELALVDESCVGETALHDALVASPARAVTPAELDAIDDVDARANYRTYLAFRDALLAAGTLEAYYLALMRSGQVTIPPAFVERIVQAIVRHSLDANANAFEARAAEMLYRPQRLTLTDGCMLAADLATIDLLNETAGFGDIGRLLVQSKAPMAALQMTVLRADNAPDYWEQSGPRRERHGFVLDLTHEIASDVGHGLTFTMTRAHSGLTALARVLERWLAHLLGVQVVITPLQNIADATWRWHVGLDVESMALLNDLYEDRPVAEGRMQRLISLFKLEFTNPAEMRADVAGKPVYLGLAMTPDGTLKLKPQNLLLNLPLAATM
jgi:hypothetical protein